MKLDTVKSGLFIVCIEGSKDIVFDFFLTNGADPDKMPHNAAFHLPHNVAFHLGLNCLSKNPFFLLFFFLFFFFFLGGGFSGIQRIKMQT